MLNNLLLSEAVIYNYFFQKLLFITSFKETYSKGISFKETYSKGISFKETYSKGISFKETYSKGIITIK
jgi:hypothetical protein